MRAIYARDAQIFSRALIVYGFYRLRYVIEHASVDAARLRLIIDATRADMPLRRCRRRSTLCAATRHAVTP